MMATNDHTGMDFYINLGRRGNRVARRKHARAAVGGKHQVTKTDAVDWFQKKFDGIVLNK
jgi:large subunit ribosomal protein L11e